MKKKNYLTIGSYRCCSQLYYTHIECEHQYYVCVLVKQRISSVQLLSISFRNSTIYCLILITFPSKKYGFRNSCFKRYFGPKMGIRIENHPKLKKKYYDIFFKFARFYIYMFIQWVCPLNAISDDTLVGLNLGVRVFVGVRILWRVLRVRVQFCICTRVDANSLGNQNSFVGNELNFSYILTLQIRIPT